MAGWVPTIATFRRLIGRPVKDLVHSLLLVYAFSLGLDVEGGASIFIAGLQITLVGVAVCLDFFDLLYWLTKCLSAFHFCCLHLLEIDIDQSISLI